MLMRKLVPFAIALLLPAASARAQDQVVATVDGQNITLGELEKTVKAQLIEVDNQRYEILEEGLGALISERLMTKEAESQGKTLQAFQQELMTAAVEEPTDADVQKVYDENKGDLGGKTLEEVRGRIVEYLKGQQRAARAQSMIAELRAKYPTVVKLSPPVVEVGDGGRPSRGGGADAPVTIIAFSDYECPFCKRAEETVAEVMANYGDKVRYVHRDYPLPFHQHARRAAEAARCAGEQEKFWEFHDAVFKADSLTDDKIGEIATTLALDKTKFDSCLSEGRTKSMIDEDMTAGGDVGVSGTPAFFINGRVLSGAQPFERFKSVIDAELEKTAAN